MLADAPHDPTAPLVEVALPVYNEERRLERGVRELRSFLDRSVPWATLVTIVDNGSTDATPALAAALAAELPGVRVLRLEQKGRGRALRAAWSRSAATVVAYMDIDLSTGLDAFVATVLPLLSGQADLGVGTRLAPTSRVERSVKREVLSRGYNRLVRVALGSRFSDAQCGFKAVRADVVPLLLSLVRDQEWFFDTELLVAAQRRGLRVHEVPVTWTEDRDSTVDIARTVWRDLVGVARLVRHPVPAAPSPFASLPPDGPPAMSDTPTPAAAAAPAPGGGADPLPMPVEAPSETPEAAR